MSKTHRPQRCLRVCVGTTLGLAALAASAGAAPAPVYRLTLIPPVPGQAVDVGSTHMAQAINDAGVVAGRVFVAADTPVGTRAAIVRWSAQEGTRLMPGGGERFPAEAAGVDAEGRVYGSIERYHDHKAIVWPEDDRLQFVSPRDRRSDSQVHGVNARGDAAGTIWETSPDDGALQQRAMLWTADGRSIELGRTRGLNASAYAVNASLQVVGQAGKTMSGGQAFLWSPGEGMQLLGRLPGSKPSGQTEARDINDAGQVVGHGTLEWLAPPQAFLWTAQSGYVSLGAPDSCTYTYAFAINASGAVVGNCWSASDAGGPYLWTAADGFRFLQALIDPADPLLARTRLVTASDINADGTVVGWGFFDGLPMPIVMTRVP